jgi:hypothetical protein
MTNQTSKLDVNGSKISAEIKRLEDPRRLDQIANEGGGTSWTDRAALRRESRYIHKVEEGLRTLVICLIAGNIAYSAQRQKV